VNSVIIIKKDRNQYQSHAKMNVAMDNQWNRDNNQYGMDVYENEDYEREFESYISDEDGELSGIIYFIWLFGLVAQENIIEQTNSHFFREGGKFRKILPIKFVQFLERYCLHNFNLPTIFY
jgi:hypothetical protein